MKDVLFISFAMDSFAVYMQFVECCLHAGKTGCIFGGFEKGFHAI